MNENQQLGSIVSLIALGGFLLFLFSLWRSRKRNAYQRKMHTRKWKRFAYRIKCLRRWTCEGCGKKTRWNLQTHHCFYISGLEPEDEIYLIMDIVNRALGRGPVLQVLCGKCHAIESGKAA